MPSIKAKALKPMSGLWKSTLKRTPSTKAAKTVTMKSDIARAELKRSEKTNAFDENLIVYAAWSHRCGYNRAKGVSCCINEISLKADVKSLSWSRHSTNTLRRFDTCSESIKVTWTEEKWVSKSTHMVPVGRETKGKGIKSGHHHPPLPPPPPSPSSPRYGPKIDS